MHESEGNSDNFSDNTKRTITPIGESFVKGSFPIMAVVIIFRCWEFLHFNQLL